MHSHARTHARTLTQKHNMYVCISTVYLERGTLDVQVIRKCKLKKKCIQQNLERGGLDVQAICNLDCNLDLSALWTHHPFFFVFKSPFCKPDLCSLCTHHKYIRTVRMTNMNKNEKEYTFQALAAGKNQRQVAHRFLKLSHQRQYARTFALALPLPALRACVRACVHVCVRACVRAGATQTVSACQQGNVHTHTHTRPAGCCSRQGDWISVMQLRAAWLFVCGGVFVCACVCACVRAIRACHRSRPLVTLLLPHRTCHDKLFGGCVKVKHHADPALPRLLLLRWGRLLRVTSSRCARACGRTGIWL
jgi:hypothetical protein